ncbi:sulfatase-like hydrolase/transferase [Phytoactinopolyspora halotolerans]|uniref:Sulfatase-like hydrolase/transferase n=1 Tax=Phytoactinopolyspora halotolerans TaxID=1981512 RepID=A0A6L9S3R6_9ACTN|nr:sulfatase-like hydrolase/transferase [Phytoactinopolyspora halotolerans]NED99702.1 sulfatase-like hydrolase/transferase [Phytoactinopolyspora halotolerans]
MTRGPNIVLITTDQQRYDTVGPRAPDFLRTPHLDHMAREGITYSSAYAQCPMCVPSRVSIMTGRTVAGHGMAHNGHSSEVVDRETSLPSMLRQAGYQTAAIGKMHFTPERARHGFDEMLLPADYYTEMTRRGHDVQPMRHGLGQNELYPGMATVPESLTLTSWTAERCVDYIRERRDPTVPFFLWCSFSKPHPPLDPPEPYYSMYLNSPIPEPVFGDWSEDERCPEAFRRAREKWSLDLIPPEVIRAARAAYYGLVTHIDYAIGRVFAALQDLRMFDDTLLVFTSDHGEYLGDHHTGAKTFFHEASAHVPFIVRLPKSWDDRRHGTTVADPVTHADIMPTLLAAAGQPAPGQCDGQDLFALARGELDSPRRYVDGVGRVPDATYHAITDGRWKYIHYPEGDTEQLFDVENDPDERTDLSGSSEHEKRRADLRQELIDLLERRGSEWVRDGRLVSQEPFGDTTRDRRNESWPGYHTERHDVDVRH